MLIIKDNSDKAEQRKEIDTPDDRIERDPSNPRRPKLDKSDDNQL